MPNTMMASVTMDETGRMTASLNPNLTDKQRLVLACQCAQMYAQIAAQAALAQGEEEKKPQILVPKMTGIKL